MEIVCSLRGQTFLELKLLYPGDQLDFWKLLVAKALEGPGLGQDGEFSKLLEKSLVPICWKPCLVFDDGCSARAEPKSVIFWGNVLQRSLALGTVDERNPAPLLLHQLRQIKIMQIMRYLPYLSAWISSVDMPTHSYSYHISKFPYLL